MGGAERQEGGEMRGGRTIGERERERERTIGERKREREGGRGREEREEGKEKTTLIFSNTL